MGRGKLTYEEIEELKRNPYVVSVDANRIMYSEEFKKLFMRRYIGGERPGAIFRSAGFDTEVLGSKRVERACARWRELYCSGALDVPGIEEIPAGTDMKRKMRERKKSDPLFCDDERLRLLENLIARQSEVIKEQRKEIKTLRKENRELITAQRKREQREGSFSKC